MESHLIEKISPNPSLSKRGCKFSIWKGEVGGVIKHFVYYRKIPFKYNILSANEYSGGDCMNFQKMAVFLLLLISILSISNPVSAISEEEKTFLSMYFKDEELVVLSATRSLKSITRVAENVEVVTAEDIELMNAHTLADVLYNINGVNVGFAGSSPGNMATVLIQSSEIKHVAVFIDGILLNNLASNAAEIGPMPVQHIEKVEVIKGPASSVWGSSLGGVINIITKSPPKSEKTDGSFSASYSKRDTGDFRAEISGRKDRFGFYISAGRLMTDGLRPENDVSENNVYTKLTYDLSSNTNILFSMLYLKTSRGAYEDISADIFGRNKNEQLQSSLSLNAILSKEADLNISVRSSVFNDRSWDYQINDGSMLSKITAKQSSYGASAKLTWSHGIHSMVAGADYDDGTLKSNVIADGKKGIRKWAIFANDTIVLNKFSVIPGIRYDNTDTNGDFISPSLGVTYELTENTLIRAYVARGFSIPSLITTYGDNIYIIHNSGLKVEKVWSYQAGIETGALKYLWLKLSAFRHDIEDGLVPILVSVDPDTNIPTSRFVNREKLRRQGFEVETKSLQFYNMTLSAAASYVETENRLTGEEIRDVPKYAYNIGLHYDDKKSFRAVLHGNYTWWNSEDYHLAKYSSFIFDLNMIKTFYKKDAKGLEAFLTAHNIFNGSQYWDFWYKNPKRWFEAGIRYKF